MKITSLGLTFITNIGLNEARKQKIAKEFEPEFPLNAEVNPGGFFAILKDMGTERIVLGLTDFTYFFDKPDATPDFKQIGSSVQKVFNILMLDPPERGMCRITALEPTPNTLALSLAGFQSAAAGKVAAKIGAQGVGLRFVIKDQVAWSEYKIEPNLNNPDELYLERIAHIGKVGLDAMFEKMEE